MTANSVAASDQLVALIEGRVCFPSGVCSESTDKLLLRTTSVHSSWIAGVQDKPSISLHLALLPVQHWSQNFFSLLESSLQTAVVKSWLHSRHELVSRALVSLANLLDDHSSFVCLTRAKVLLVSAWVGILKCVGMLSECSA